MYIMTKKSEYNILKSILRHIFQKYGIYHHFMNIVHQITILKVKEL